MFLEAFQDYIDLVDYYESVDMKVDAYVEATIRELNINREESELKVMQESGTEEDLQYLYTEAEEGALAKIKKAIRTIIEAFKQFCSDLKSKVVRIIVNAETKTTLKKIEKKVKLNPFFARKKVQVIDKKKPLKVIADYKSKAEKHLAKVKSGVFKESEITAINRDKDNYASAYKAAIAGTAATITVTVVKLLADINAEYNALPGHIDKIDKETSQILENLCTSLDKEEQAVVKAAFTTAANFRAKLARDEANEHVDAIMNKISVLKKSVLKAKDGDKVQANPIKESSEDEEDGYDAFEESGTLLDDDFEGLFDGYMESEEDYYESGAMSADDLLDDLDSLLED